MKDTSGRSIVREMSTTPYTVGLDEPADHDLVGGKAANLIRLSALGFRVPRGFVITTAAYRDFLSGAGLIDPLTELSRAFEHNDPDGLEQATGKVRQLIVDAAMPPAIAEQIRAQYDGRRVAVRSSGTAEDLAEASFAGQHDTYLDIEGTDAVLDAVRRCWASLWTARATAYRHRTGFDHLDAALAVVVQELVDADVSGVLFTGNPITASTQEIVVNACPGLGEALVSGQVVPDSFTLHHRDLRILERNRGESATLTLTDRQLTQLGELALRIQTTYDGIPQDVEWCLRDDEFHVLQSRPITGVPFAWADELDTTTGLRERDDTVWTRSYADEVWSGPISPLTYSYRDHVFTNAYHRCFPLWGMPEGSDLRVVRYHRGTVYYNTDVEKLILTRSQLPAFRISTTHVSPAELEEIKNAPLSPTAPLRTQLRILRTARTKAIHRWIRLGDSYLTRIAEADGKTTPQIRDLTDGELIDYAEQMIDFETRYVADMWTGYFIHIPLIFTLFGGIVAKFHSEQILWDLLTGSPEQSATVRENLGLWELSRDLRRDHRLRELLDRDEFPSAFEHDPDGQAWARRYRDWAGQHPHRGHADRDMYFPRRAEDPRMDQIALRALLPADDDADPLAKEHTIEQRRLAAEHEVRSALRRSPLGRPLLPVFGWLYRQILAFNVHRDNQRHWYDRSTFTIKRTFLEIAHRLTARGVLHHDGEIHFLGRHEAYQLLRGHRDPLLRARITARRADFDAVNAREAELPSYLWHGKPIRFGDDEDGGLTGVGTSPGTVTGTARVVKSLTEIGRIEHGDIMICQGTDPGWTPAFLAVAGVISETGGMLSHFSCLSREYGIPAVQLTRAMRTIPEGATITLDGTTGTVTITSSP